MNNIRHKWLMFLHQSLLGMAMARYDKVWQGGAWEAGRTSLREMFKRPIAGETPPRQMLQQRRTPAAGMLIL
jgi:hypothetical protein